MHIVSVLKKINPSMLEHRTKYVFESTSRHTTGTILGPTFSDRNENAGYLSSNVKWHTIPQSIKIPIIREILYCLKVGRELKELKGDIINLNSHLQISALPVLIASARYNIPFIVTVHGVFSKTNALIDFAQKVYLHTFCRLLWRNAKAVVCLTEADADEIVSYGCPRRKITIIPNWVNTKLFCSSTEKQDNKIVWAGRFVPPKGIEYLIESAKIVVKKFPHVKFVLIGDGPLKSEIAQSISDAGLDEYFELKGFLPQDMVAKEMGTASVFVFPSVKEGMPYALLEAAACGLAIVASDIPGVRLTLGDDNAVLVRPQDAEALAEAIMRVLSSEELRSNLQQKARKLVEQAYTAEDLFNKTIDLYELVIQKQANTR